MVKYTKSAMPATRIHMDTNANQPFKPEYLLMNNINCSIDGMDSESYGIYRKGGDFDKAIEFMRDGIKLKKKADKTLNVDMCKINWKYILFDGNDAIEQLNEAQRIAKDLDIYKLCFIITHGPTPSKRYKNLDHLIKYIQGNKIFSRTTCSYAT